MTARCEVTELLVGECAHCRGTTLTPDEELTAEQKQLLAAARWFHAIYPGLCACCGEPFTTGALIRMELPCGWRADCCREDTP